MIVLDTHTLVWWAAQDPALSTKGKKCIEEELTSADGLILVSSISAWEIALLVERGRLTLTMDVQDWLDTVSEIEALTFVPVDNHLAVQSVRLPGEFHADPADRLIVALARHHSASLVTADKKIRDYKHVKAVW